jgi:cytochrome b561
MSTTVPSPRYATSMIVLHWATLLVIIGVYACIELREFFPRGSALREGLKAWHFQLGLTVLLLTVARIGLRLCTRVPPVAPPLQTPQKLAAIGVHLALYGFLLAMPLLGWALLDLEGKAVVWFGLTLPDLLASSHRLAESLEEIHETLGKVGYGLIGLHAAAALFHHYIQRDNTLIRMLPGR